MAVDLDLEALELGRDGAVYGGEMTGDEDRDRGRPLARQFVRHHLAEHGEANPVFLDHHRRSRGREGEEYEGSRPDPSPSRRRGSHRPRLDVPKPAPCAYRPCRSWG